MSKTKYAFKQAGFGDSPEEAMEEYGVIVNDFDSFEKRLDASSKLHFVYILHSDFIDNDPHVTQLHRDIIAPAVQEMKGLVNVLVFDCQHPHVKIKKFSWLDVCKPELNPKGMPNLQLVIPPQFKLNPYTGKPMQKQVKQFQEGGGINIPILKDWIAKDMPDYTIKIKSKQEFD